MPENRIATDRQPGIPDWFKGLAATWLCFGLPVFFLGQGFRGHFSLLPDPPPFLYPGGAVEIAIGTLFWVAACFIVYLPLFLLPALFVWRRRQAGKSNAED